MQTITDNAVPPEVVADAEAVVRSLETGVPLPKEVRDRIRQRAKQVTERIYREQGLVDIAVPAVRELRGELPGP